jgi:hypothetical protein
MYDSEIKCALEKSNALRVIYTRSKHHARKFVNIDAENKISTGQARMSRMHLEVASPIYCTCWCFTSYHLLPICKNDSLSHKMKKIAGSIPTPSQRKDAVTVSFRS